MKRNLIAASLAALLLAAPLVASAQTDGTSSYSDTVPKKSGAHHAGQTGQHGKKHQGSKHHGSKHHKGKTKKSSAAK